MWVESYGLLTELEMDWRPLTIQALHSPSGERANVTVSLNGRYKHSQQSSCRPFTILLLHDRRVEEDDKPPPPPPPAKEEDEKNKLTEELRRRRFVDEESDDKKDNLDTLNS